MLTAITLNNFKSYQTARLPLAPLTVMIGANASGKSNAIEAMRLLSWLAHGQKLSSIQYAVQKGDRVIRGRAVNLPYRQTGEFGLGCEIDRIKWNRLKIRITRRDDELHVAAETVTHPWANVALYNLDQPSSGRNTDVGVAYNNFRQGPKPHVRCNDQAAIFTQLMSPATFNKNPKSGRLISEVATQYEKVLSSILFLDPVPAKMRDYSFPVEKALQSDGENLSGILFNLWGDKTKDDDPFTTHRKDILAFVQSLPEQDISGLGFLEEPRGGRLVFLTETFGEKSHDYDASLLSDGTLRVLAIAAAMLSAAEGSLVVIEEIDNGVHPSRAKHLLAKIREIAERRKLRVLLSTHNPALLDALPDRAIPDVVYCYRDPQDGSSRLVRLEEIPDYPELIAQGALGYLSTSGVLEKFVKNRPSSDEKKAKALAWLDSMRSGGAQ
jgi:predicted ATPase